MIKISRAAIFFKFGSRAHLNKIRDLDLSLRRGRCLFKLAEGLGLTEAGIKISEDMEWNEQRVATTGQGITSLLA
jgi:hypothetical protein